MQYLSFLEQQGLQIKVSPLLDDDYLQSLYRGQRPSPGTLLSRYSRRLFEVLRGGSFDIVWLEKEVFPMLPAIAEQYMAVRGIPFVVDYDDASFHNYDLSPNAAVRFFLGKKIDKVMRVAGAVSAGNDYLAARARSAGARRVEIIPSVIDLDDYPVCDSKADAPFTIGWIGTPMTAKYLVGVADALRVLSEDGDVLVRLIGSGPTNLPGVAVDVKDWEEAQEASDVGTFDVGIMPLPDDAWERGKCGYKLIQYMACGKPVVASPVGANKKIVEHGRNGFLAGSTDEWVSALRELRDKPGRRAAMGIDARATVEARYCLQVTGPKLLSLLRSVASQRT